MSTELRSTTFTVKVNVDGKEKIVEVTRAVSDLDGAEQSIRKSLGDVASVTTSVVKSQKELNQQTKVAIQESERQHKQLKRVVDEYSNLNKMLEMAPEKAEIFNAQMRAGVDPMSKQGQKIAELVTEHQRLAAAQGQQQGSLRDARGMMQNFGWQMQDTIVQMQMGTSAFVVLSQQGSQMAAAFGPTGAIVGAFIALAGVVGGSLFAGMMDTKTAMEKFKASADELAETLKRNEDGSWGFSESLQDVAMSSSVAGRALAALGQIRYAEFIKQGADSAKEAFDDLFNMTDSFDDKVSKLTGAKTPSLFGNMDVNPAELGQARDAISELQSSMTELSRIGDVQSVDRYITALSDIVHTFSSTLPSAAKTYLEEQLRIAAQLRKTMGASDGLADSVKNYVGGLEKEAATMSMTSAERRRYEAGLINLPPLLREHVNGILDKIDAQEAEAEANKKSAKSSDDLARKLESEYRARENIRKQLENAQKRQGKKDDPRSGEQAQYEENIRLLSEQYNAASKLGEKGLEEKKRINALALAETQRHNSAIAAIDKKEAADSANDALNLKRQQSAAIIRLYDDQKFAAMERLAAQYQEDIALFEGNEAMKAEITAKYQEDIRDINATGLDKWARDTQKALENNDKLVEESLNRFVSGFGDAFASSIMGAESVGDAFKGMFEGMASSMLKYFGEWAAQELLMFALKGTLAKTEMIANVAVAEGKSKQTAFEAAAAAYKSAADIPGVGWLLAPAAGAAAFTAVSAFGSDAVAGAQSAIPTFDKGGVIPTKGYGIVSEFGDELVGGTLVYNNTPNGLNVTGREDTARLLAGNRSTTNNVTVHSSGNASPEAIGRAVDRVLRRKSKKTDNAVYDSMNRGRKNRGARFNA